MPTSETLQLATITLEQNQTFKPHKHNYQPRRTVVSQESWCVIKGKVKAILYDLDDTILAEVELMPGDLSLTLAGGHNYEALEPSIVYEYKTGPYHGQITDKTFL